MLRMFSDVNKRDSKIDPITLQRKQTFGKQTLETSKFKFSIFYSLFRTPLMGG